MKNKEEIKEELHEHHEANKKKLKAAGPVKLTILAIMLIGTICSYVFYDYIYGTHNAWCTAPDTGYTFLNDICLLIPRLITCIQASTVILTIVTIILFIIGKCFGRTQRSITVSRLIANLIRWLTAIILVIVILAIWGFDTTALITGAGVITLVVGLGMQSLIADVVAGLFIVFENEFNIGDYITVDGFRGEVIEIGIRTTKLKALGNIKIFNNNAIQGVLNHTTDNSVAFTHIDIEYGANLPQIEGIIRTHVGTLKVPGARSEIRYDGVSALGASGVTLQFEVDCYEGDIFAVGRAMNGAIKNMFDENGIGIPFPQIVIHNGN